MGAKSTSPAERAGLRGENEWLRAVRDRRVRPRPRKDDVRAIVFAVAANEALNRWNHADTVPTARVTSFRSARTLLAERIGTTDALVHAFIQGRRQIDKARFEKAMQVELFGKSLVCFIPDSLLLCATVAGVLPNGINNLTMTRTPDRRAVDIDVKYALHQVEDLARFLADAQTSGRLRQYAGADWQQVLAAMRPAKSRREVVRRALVDRQVLTNAEAREILVKAGMTATPLQVAQTFSSLTTYGIAEPVRHGVHRLSGSAERSSTQASPLALIPGSRRGIDEHSITPTDKESERKET